MTVNPLPLMRESLASAEHAVCPGWTVRVLLVRFLILIASLGVWRSTLAEEIKPLPALPAIKSPALESPGWVSSGWKPVPRAWLPTRQATQKTATVIPQSAESAVQTSSERTTHKQSYK